MSQQEASVTCEKCGDQFESGQMCGSMCRWCQENSRFAAFAASCGLTRYPDPSGERYVYRLDGSCDGKKGECTDFIDELWNALAEAKNETACLVE